MKKQIKVSCFELQCAAAKKETVAELQARKSSLEQSIVANASKTDAGAKLQLRADQAEVAEIEARMELVTSADRLAALEASNTQRLEKDAEQAVSRMVESGAIAVRNVALQANWKAKFVADPSLIEITASAAPVSGAAGGRMTPSANSREALAASNKATPGLEVYAGAMDVLKGIALNCSNQNKIEGMSLQACRSRRELADRTAMIYEKEIRAARFDSDGLPMMKTDYLSVPLEAAAEGDTLGTLVGTLVSQRMLDLFRYSFPLLKLVMTDMSDEPSDLNQAVKTRKVLIPAVQSFDDTLDTDNRPKGWSTASLGATTDISITLDELVGVPIAFSMATLSSTQRKLFTEQAPAAMYALTKYWMAKVYAICTAANFADYAAVTAAGSDGIVKVPNAYATYAEADINFGRKSLGKIAAAFDANEVPEDSRTALLNAQYYDAATNDPTLVSFYAGQQSPEIVTEGRLPRLKGFNIVKAANFPSSGNRVGMALQKNAMLIKSRLPSNYQDLLPGSGNGSITQISDAQTGLSIMLIQYVNNTRGFAEWLPCVIIGAAKGDTRGGMVITSA